MPEVEVYQLKGMGHRKRERYQKVDNKIRGRPKNGQR